MQRIKIISKKVQHCRRTLSDFNTYYKGILIKIVLFYYKHVLVCEMSILVYLSLSIYIYIHTHTQSYIYIHTCICFCQRRRWHQLQYACLESPMDGGAWKAAVHGVTEGQT